jgi:hypothetical protein
MSAIVKDTNAVLKYIKFLGNNTIPLQLLALRSYLEHYLSFGLTDNKAPN